MEWLSSSQARATNIEQWHPMDLEFTSTNSYANPFEGVSITGKFTGPGGVTLTIPGFYEGLQVWKIRFSPTVPGSWSYITSSSDNELNGQTGSLTCVSNTNPEVHGGLAINSLSKHYFVYQDGTPCFPMSFEADWLGEMDFGNTNIPDATSLINIYKGAGFNDVMMCVYAYDTTWEAGNTSVYDFGPPAVYAWQGSNSSPNHTEMNPSYFDNLDLVINYLFQNGIIAHVFFKVNNKGVNWPTEGSADENLYFTYVTARYQAYPNIVWDFEKEGKNETGGNTYVNTSILTIKSLDAYHRLMTVHDDLSYYSAFPNTCDFQTIQADGTPFYSTLISDRNARVWPVFEGEYDYQIGNDGGHTYSVTDTQSRTLADTLECVMAGSPANYYYTYHAWDVVRYYETPQGLSAYGNIVHFFNGTAWSSLAPGDTLITGSAVGRHCLAAPGSEYVVYLSGTGSVTVTVSGAPSGNSLAASWLDVATGARATLPDTGNGSLTFTNPWPDPALLHLTTAIPLTPVTWDNLGASPSDPHDGSGTWNTSGASWSNGSADVVWNNAGNFAAVFGDDNGPAGAVAIGNVTAGGLAFNPPGSGSYVLTSGTLTLSGSAPAIIANTEATIDALVTGTGATNIGGLGTLILSGSCIDRGPITISGGIVQVTGSLSTSSTLTVSGSSVFYLAGGSLSVSSAVTNNGIFKVSGIPSLSVAGFFINNGVLDLINGPSTLPSDFVNNGAVLNAAKVTVQQVAMTGTGFNLSVQSHPQHTYQLQGAGSLANPVWTNIGPSQAGTGSVLKFVDPAGGASSQEFYQIVVSP
jgi:hypothetical protein